MALPDKLPRDPMYKTYEMTEADWEEYFECRKKYDIEYTKSEEDALMDQVTLFLKEGNKKAAEELMMKLPVKPGIALNNKTFAGFKTIQKYNLSLAKKVYPDEF